MELNIEILAHFLSQQNAQIIFPGLRYNAKEIVELQCYQTLSKIQKILHDETLDDTECFQRIEEIICEFEAIGSSGGYRHDFG